jgi:hypothetical protein
MPGARLGRLQKEIFLDNFDFRLGDEIIDFLFKNYSEKSVWLIQVLFVVQPPVVVQGTASYGKESLYKPCSNCIRDSHWDVVEIGGLNNLALLKIWFYLSVSQESVGSWLCTMGWRHSLNRCQGVSSPCSHRVKLGSI